MTRCFSVFLVLVLAGSVCARNLLQNPGFEDPAGWSNHWTIRDANGGNVTYHYHLTPLGGGHGDARPRTGKNALEIYSTDRRTYLVQKVSLESGTYRLSVWASLNNTPDFAPMELKLGDQSRTLPLASEGYRRLWADFEIKEPGDYEAIVHSTSYGVAVDDVALEKVTETNVDSLPVLYVDLFPSSRERAAGIQYCLKGTPQWVNFAVTCMAQQRLKRPIMRVFASEPVKLSGLSEFVIHNYRMRAEEEVKLKPETTVRQGRTYRGFSFPLPSFVLGLDKPLRFGGCWVSNVPPKGGKLIMEIVDGESTLAREFIGLVPVDPPKRVHVPTKYYTLSYAAQDWQMSKEERLKALPTQFRMMGLNVWSTYGLVAEKPAPGLSAEEQVEVAAYKKGVRWFWPNFSSMINTGGGGTYSDASGESVEKDMFIVTKDGKTLKDHFNFNYIANRGRVWMASAMAAWTRSQARPIQQKLALRYGGYVNDSLEGIYYSYDPSTLAEFARFKGVSPPEVTVEKLDGEWKQDWLRFNLELYARVVDVWAQELRRADPNVKIVNTADTYGPGGTGSLTPHERMIWARSVDYNMPQWYASNYYGSSYIDQLTEGDKAKVFGKANGGCDLIPLLYLTMGGKFNSPDAIRFIILDLCSASKSVKGIGYYIGSYGFADAKFMVGLSRAHTLLADVEDYYADGVREDGMVTFTRATNKRDLIPGMDMEGNQVMLRPNVSTTVRVHRLNKAKRIALISVFSHSEQGAGEKIVLDIDTKRLPKGGKGLVLIDRLTGRISPLTSKVKVDTGKTKNVALFEIAGV